jgi:hypothetical protein
MNQTSQQHTEVDELLPAAALEMLESEDHSRVVAHAQECGECARLLEEFRAVVAALGTGLPLEPLDAPRSARLRERLLARTLSHTPPAAAEIPSNPSGGFRYGALDRWTGWAVAAGLAGVLLIHHGFHRPLAYGWVVAGISTVALVAFGVYAMVQRRRVAVLEAQLAQREQHEARQIT